MKSHRSHFWLNLSFVCFALVALPRVHAQVPKNVQMSQAAATRGQIIEDLKFGTGRTGSFLSGSTLSIAGTLSGTPTGGTLNLSNLTLTLPTTFLTAAQLVASNGSGPNAVNGLVHWSQIVGVPAVFADGSDDGSGGGGLASTDIDTSAELRAILSDETGTGALVFATSPTFVTPALGTPSSATLTNATGLPIATGVSGLGTGVATALAVNVGSAGAVVANGGALGTPSSGTLTNATGLPIATGVSGLGTGVGTFLATPTGANLASALTNETGTGVPVFNVDPVILHPDAAQAANEVDVTKKNGTKTYTGTSAVTWTRTATPADGQPYGVRVTTDTALTVTLWGTVFSEPRNANLSANQFVIPVGTYQINFERHGSTDVLVTDPITINDLSTITVASGDKVPVYDVSAGSDGTTTVANLVLAGMPALTGDITSSAGAAATTLATVNANVGTFGGATASAAVTLNAKGLATAASNVTITPAVGSITGLGTGIATALAVNVGSSGAPVVNGGALGTPSSGTLTNATGLPVSTGVSGLGTGVATALAANANATGGVVTTNGTATLSNKRVDARITTITSSATPTINTDNCDAVTITALAAAITSMTTNLSGTPVNFDQLMFRIKDDGTGRAITWGASFAARGAALPTTTTAGKVLTALFLWNSVTSTWDCISTANES